MRYSETNYSVCIRSVAPPLETKERLLFFPDRARFFYVFLCFLINSIHPILSALGVTPCGEFGKRLAG